jgi:hypothetical protein
MTKGLLAAALLAATLALLALGAGEARAQVSWPARCTTFACVNSHMNNLHSRLRTATTVNNNQRNQILALQRTNAQQRTQINVLNAAIECIGFEFVPASSFGNLDPAAGIGYVFRNPPSDPEFTTAAVDWDFGSAAPDFFLVAADPDCLTPIAGSRRSGSDARPRTYRAIPDLARDLRVPVP